MIFYTKKYYFFVFLFFATPLISFSQSNTIPITSTLVNYSSTEWNNTSTTGTYPVYMYFFIILKLDTCLNEGMTNDSLLVVSLTDHGTEVASDLSN